MDVAFPICFAESEIDKYITGMYRWMKIRGLTAVKILTKWNLSEISFDR